MGMMLTSLDVSLFPLNLFFHLTGVLGWFVVGMLWHDRSLIVVNGIAIAIFSMGIIKHFFWWCLLKASMAELVDATDLKSVDHLVVWVRLPLDAPISP